MQRLKPEHLRIENRKTLLRSNAPEPVVGASGDIELHDTTQSEVADVFEAARSQGFQEGLALADIEITKRVSEIQSELTAIHDKSITELNNTISGMKALMCSMDNAVIEHSKAAHVMSIEVAYAATTKILGKLHLDKTLINELCASLSSEYGNDVTKLSLCESDRKLVELTNFNYKVDIDQRLKPGQCILETKSGFYNCGIDVRLDSIKNELLKSLLENVD